MGNPKLEAKSLEHALGPIDDRADFSEEGYEGGAETPGEESGREA